MIHDRIVGRENETVRHGWVEEKLHEISKTYGCRSLLDVGAGMSPYKGVALSNSLSYKSHDFSSYVPSSKQMGIQDKSWAYPTHDFTCDVLEIPVELKFDGILCTEVLEHVPDPVRTFDHLCNLLKPNGLSIVTVPFLSLMHQAPYWFQSGLSPFWFEERAKESKLQILELTVNGDYVDFLSQEIKRLFQFSHRTKFIGQGLAFCIQNLRSRISKPILESGAFGVMFLGRRQPN